MFRRVISASLLLVLTALGTSACNMLSPVASMIEYAPSDGTQGDFGGLKARNVMILTDHEHSALFGAFANESSKKLDFAVGYLDEKKNMQWRLVTVDPYKVLNFGYQGEKPLKISKKVDAGSIEKVTLGDDEGTFDLNVPVLDDSLPQYKELVANLKNL